MSAVVDERIVEMRFDNSNFEKNVRQSIDTLEELDKKLKAQQMTNALQDLDKASKGLNLNGLTTAIGAVSNKFSAMEVIAVGALIKIGQQAVAAGEKLVKSLTIDQVSSGFQEYELKMDSIQTIMAGTGESLDKVKEKLEELNEYADKTIYSFSDMTENISKFTNAGVKLDMATDAIKGISNVAALAGASSNQASHAMLNFSQALSTGYIQLIDWKSIKNAQMDTIAFKQSLADTAVAMGTLVKNGEEFDTTTTDNNGKIAEGLNLQRLFNDGLKNQWLTTEVLTETLQQYSTDVTQMSAAEKEAYETKLKGMGYTQEQIANIEKLGTDATKAATQVKTFTQLLDTLKEAVGSGWAMTFEYIIGDFNQAKELWTAVSDEIGGVINKQSEARNQLIKTWSQNGGRDDLIAGIKNIYNSIKNIFTAIKDGIREVFPELKAGTLIEFTKRFRELTEKVLESTQSLDWLKDIVVTLMTPIKTVLSFIGAVLVRLPAILNIVGKLVSFILKLVFYIGKLIVKSKILEHIFDGIKVIFGTVIAIIGGIILAIKSLIEAVKNSKIIQTIISKVSDGVVKAIEKMKKAFAFLKTGFEALLAGKDIFVGWLEELKKKITEIFNKLQKLPVIGTFITAITKVLSTAFKIIKEGTSIIVGFLASFLTDPSGTINAIVQKMQEFGEAISAWYSESKLKVVIDFLKEKFAKIIEIVKEFIGNVAKEFKKMDIADILLLTLGAGVAYTVIELGYLFKKIGVLAGSISGTFKTLKKVISGAFGGDSLANKIMMFSAALLVLTISLVALSEVPEDKLIKACAALLTTVTILGAVALGIGYLSNVIGPKGFTSIKALGQGVVAMAASILLIAGAFFILNKVDAKDLWDKAWDLVIVMGGITGAVIAISKFAPVLAKGSILLIAIAASVAIICKAMTNFANLGNTKLEDATTAIFVVMGSLALIASMMSGIKFGGALGLFLLVSSLAILFHSIQKIDINGIEGHLEQIISAIKYISIALIALKIAQLMIAGFKMNTPVKQVSGALQIMAGLLAFALSLYIVLQAYKECADLKVDANQIGRLGLMLLNVLAIFAIVALIGKISGIDVSIKNLATSSLMLVGCIAILIEIAKKCKDIDTNAFDSCITAILFISGAMALMLAFSGRSNKSSSKTILAMLASFSIILVELLLMAQLLRNPERLKGIAIATLLVESILLSMAAMMASLKGVGKSSSVSVIGLIAGMSIIMISLVLLAKEVGNSEHPILSLLAVALAGVIVIVAIKAFAKACTELAQITRKSKWGPLIIMITMMGLLLGELIAVAAVVGNSEHPMEAMYGMLIAAVAAIASLLAFAEACVMVSKITREIKWEVLIAMLGMMQIIMVDLLVMSHLNGDWATLAAAGISLAAVLVGFGASCLLVSKMTGGIDWKSIGLMTLEMVAIAGILIGMTKLISPESLNILLVSAGSMAIVLIAFAGACYGASKLASGIDWATILAMCAMIVTIGATLGVMASKVTNPDDLLLIAISIGGAMAAIAVAAKLAQGATTGAVALVIAGVAAAAFAASFLIVSNMDWGKMLAAAAALGIVANLLAIAAIMATGSIAGAGTLVVLGIDAVLFAFVIKQLADMDPKNMEIAALAIATAAGTLAIAAYLASGAIVGAATLAILGADALLFGLSIKQLVGMDPKNMEIAALAIATAAGTLAIAAYLATGAIIGAVSLAILGADALLFGLAIKQLTDMDPNSMIKAALALATAAGTLTAVAYLATGAAIGAASLVILGAATIVLAKGFKELGEVNWISIISTVPMLPLLASGLIQVGVAALKSIPGLVGLAIAFNSFSVSIPILLLASVAINSFANAIIIGLSEAITVTEKFYKVIKLFALQSAAEIISSSAKVAVAFFSAGLLWGKSLEEGFREGARWHSPPVWETDLFKDIKDTLFASDLPSTMSNFGEKLGSNLGDAFGDASTSSIGNALKDAGITLDIGTEDLENLWNGFNLKDKSVNYDININENHNVKYNDLGSGTVSEYANKAQNDLRRTTEAYETAQNKYEKLAKARSDLDKRLGTVSHNDKEIAEAAQEASRLWGEMQKAQTAVDGLNDAFKTNTKTAEEASEAENDLFDAISGVGGSAKEVKTPLQELTETIAGQIDIFSEFSKETDLSADKILSNMRSQIQGVTEWATQLNVLGAKGIDQGLLQKLQEMGPQGYKYVNAFSQMTAEQLAEANNLWIQSINLPSMAAGLATGTFDIGNNIVQGLANGINKNAEIANTAGYNVGETTVDSTAEGAGCASPSRKTYQTGIYVIEGLVNGLRSREDHLYSVAREIAEIVVNIFEIKLDGKTHFAKIGKSICDGLASGIKENSSIVTTAAKKVAESTYTEACSALDINSPSKLFRSLGFNIDEGWAQGIAWHGSEVTNATVGIIKQMQNAIKSATDIIGDEADMSPVIRPVLDLSEVQNGAKKLNTMMSSNRANIASSGIFNSKNSAVGNSGNTSNSTVNNYTFNQTNNSPKALSRIDIYRQTKNQFSQLKGASVQ